MKIASRPSVRCQAVSRKTPVIARAPEPIARAMENGAVPTVASTDLVGVMSPKHTRSRPRRYSGGGGAMYLNRELWAFTAGLRHRIVGGALLGLVGVALGIARLALL